MTCRLVPLLLAIGACSAEAPRPGAPARAPAPERLPLRTNPDIGLEPGVFSLRLPAAPPPGDPVPPPGLPDPSVVAQLLPAVAGGTYDRSIGQDLVAEIAALPEERQALGLAGVDLNRLFGAAALCQDPRVLLDLEHDGQPYEAQLEVPSTSWITDQPQRDLYALSEGCVAGLLAAAGDVGAAIDGGSCDDADERAHFRSGSECRTCLEIDGDHARCVAEDLCPETATRQLYGAGTWFSVLRADMLMCAPDYLANVMILAEGMAEEDPLPTVYDHGAISGFCLDAWDEGDGEATLACALGDYYGLGDGMVSRVKYIRPAGSSDDAWVDRLAVTARVEVEGLTFGLHVLGESGAMAISAPNGTSNDAWGLNPLDMRPDGTDPTDPEHTQAREYIGALALKTSTTITGIFVGVSNHNRCAEEDWVGPHADGSYSCDLPGNWATELWADDALLTWWSYDDLSIYAFPLVTLATTGLPDPSVPGGLLPHVLGSTTLADPEWENCAWPETFVPDRVRMYDPQPIDGYPQYASFDGQSYWFGKDADLDIRLVLSTNQQRDFCVTGL